MSARDAFHKMAQEAELICEDRSYCKAAGGKIIDYGKYRYANWPVRKKEARKKGK